MNNLPQPPAATARGDAATRVDWRALLLWTGAALPVSLVATLAAVGRLVPPVVVLTILYVIGVALVVGRRDQVGAVVLAVPSALLIVRNAPLLMDILAKPADTVPFVSHAVPLTLAAANLVAAIMVLTGRRSGSGAAVGAAATGAVLALAVVVAAVARVA